MSLPIYANPAEAPDWQREQPVEYRYRRTAINPSGAALPVYRVKAVSRPHPWPPSKQPHPDFITRRFIEQQ